MSTTFPITSVGTFDYQLLLSFLLENTISNITDVSHAIGAINRCFFGEDGPPLVSDDIIKAYCRILVKVCWMFGVMLRLGISFVRVRGI